MVIKKFNFTGILELELDFTALLISFYSLLSKTDKFFKISRDFIKFRMKNDPISPPDQSTTQLDKENER